MNIDYSRDKFLSPFGIATVKDRYLVPGEESPQDAFARAAKAFADDEDHAQRLYDYISNLWFMPSTPILSNGGTSRGLPISCFLNYVDDSRKGITNHYEENAFLSSVGGGIGGYWGRVRPVSSKTSNGSESTGVIPFIKVVDSEMLAFSQGITRRGSYAAYLDVSHPEIEEFLDIRKPTGGDINRKSTNLHHAVIIPDSFMELIKKAAEIPGFDDSWPLIDPNTGKTVKTVPAKAIWAKILDNRVETGEPYIMFSDTVNRSLPQWLKDKGLKVHHSNLCTEIVLPTNEDRTAVCCLSSVNVEEYDSWKNNKNFIPDIVRMLDNVLTYFIKNAPPELHKAAYSAAMSRDIGLGAMGLHAYLQRHNVAFESVFAKKINKEIYRHIKQEALRADAILFAERGGAPDAAGYNRRFSHLLAPAPNASSSIICGNTSPSNDLYTANAFAQKTMSGTALLKNEYLEHLLQEYGQDTEEVWKSIITNQGSVQHLDFLTQHDKDVFKTANEIDQRWVVELAGDRAEDICQSQSVNLFYPPTVSKLKLHQDHLAAWEKGMKSLYYIRSQAIKRADKISVEINKSDFSTENDCLSCEG
jgi:ribonucleoside-diphosphate reductase alpha chain